MIVTNSTLICNSSKYLSQYGDLTEKVCEYTAAAIAGLFYLALFFLTIRCARFNHCLNSETCKVLFLVGAAVLVLHVCTNDTYEDIDDLKVKLCFEIAVNLLIGIITLSMALWIFKERPSLKCNENCQTPCRNPEHKDEGMYKLKRILPKNFVGAVTAFIFIMEVFLIVKTGKRNHQIKWLILFDKTVYLFDNIFQAIIYWYLLKRRCVPEDKVDQAQFYFKVMSFYNAVIWLDSMVNIENDLVLAYVEDSGPPWVNIVATFYKACIIDYRMMFCLVFLEHALDLSNRERAEERNNSNKRRKSGFVENLRHCISYGSGLGIFCCFLQSACILNFARDINAGAWIHSFTFLAEAIIVFFCWRLGKKLSASESEGILKIVVCCFGAVGLAYWLYSAVLVTSWAIEDLIHGSSQYDIWMIAVKFWFRCPAAFFLIKTFKQTTIENMATHDIVTNQSNNFLTGCLLFGTISEFLGAALDQYVGPITERYKYA
ncbi:hypothetical protein AC249_AIPGENE28877 [Exaiptasia diaphana]|nr:hypothetical protein AC249_AIPGENE28877 [Exaiptasia diaphana]